MDSARRNSLSRTMEKGTRDFEVLSKEMSRTPRAIEMKLKRLGVVVRQDFSRTTTTALKVRGLSTREETLKIFGWCS